MEIRCPHCGSAQTTDPATRLADIACLACGERFNYSDSDTLLGDVDLGDVESSDIVAPILTDRYQLLERLGVGASSVVWKARDKLLDRIVAIKVFRVDAGGSADIEPLCLREARATARCRDPRIVTVYDVIRLGNAVCTVCEFVPGVTLRHWRDAGQHALFDSVELCVLIAEALQQIHDVGLIHRGLGHSAGHPQLHGAGTGIGTNTQH